MQSKNTLFSVGLFPYIINGISIYEATSKQNLKKVFFSQKKALGIMLGFYEAIL